MLNKKLGMFFLLFLTSITIVAHDVLLEFKGAGFVPTSQPFREIYGSAGEFGVELTAGGLSKHLYAFSSIDFLIKNGATVELDSPTKVTVVDLAIGLKYFIPFKHGDFYFGLGAQPTRISMTDETTIEPAQWTCGGIAKAGVIFNMPYSFFADLFVDYSFAKFNASLGSTPAGTTSVNGCLFGLGFGYRFN